MRTFLMNMLQACIQNSHEKLQAEKKFCSLLHEDRLLARNETMIQNELSAVKEENGKKLRRVHKSN